jgi:REP element-mobilizing transposase RayT
VHVTLRMREHVWNLRSRRSFAVVERALAAVNRRPDFGVVHFSVQGNHLHLVVEARDRGAFSSGVRALGTRLALGLNRMMERRGPVLADRFHAHLLTTPAEARNALAYVLDNFRGHAVRRGDPPGPPVPDRYASATAPAGRPLVVPPRSWLLRAAVSAAETPPSR